MKLLTFNRDGIQLAVQTETGLYDLSKGKEWSPEFPETMEEIIRRGEEAIGLINAYVSTSPDRLTEETLIWGPSVPNPGKIICVGLNYRKHAEESNMPVPETPILFNKFNNTITAHKEVVLIPYNSNEVDYEAELAIVIGKTAKHVGKEEALDYVFGYTACNDLSARDLQFKTHQWLLGKSCDGFTPVGPYLVTSEEVGNPNSLAISTVVNGELRQNSNTEDMVFFCDELVSYISDHMTLEPGDIILTGTPEGVIFGYPKEKQVWLKDGDVVTIEIEKLGSITNTMKQEVR